MPLQEDGNKVLLKYQNCTNSQKWQLTKISAYGEELFTIKIWQTTRLWSPTKRSPIKMVYQKYRLEQIYFDKQKNSKALSFKNGNYSIGLKAKLNNNKCNGFYTS